MILTRRNALVLLALGATGPLSAQDRTSFRSGGVPITVERFDPPGVGARRPAVVLLHGSDGPRERYRRAARDLAASGRSVFLVHYLERTGDQRASRAAIGANLPAWTDTARDAVEWVAGQPGVDPARIGVMGVSLGGGIGLLAAAGNPRVKAVVDYFGFAPGALAGSGRLPPTLILHGAEDRVVPASNARYLDALLERQGTARELVIYPGEGHGFGPKASADAAERIRGFFTRYLGG